MQDGQELKINSISGGTKYHFFRNLVMDILVDEPNVHMKGAFLTELNFRLYKDYGSLLNLAL